MIFIYLSIKYQLSWNLERINLILKSFGIWVNYGIISKTDYKRSSMCLQLLRQ